MSHYPVYIKVAVALPVNGVFTYRASENCCAIKVGMMILVPFGARTVTGYVLAFTKPEPEVEIRDIIDILDEKPVFPESMAGFFEWISSYYIYPVGEVIETALPKGISSNDYALVSASDRIFENLDNNEKAVIGLLQKKPLEKKRLLAEKNVTPAFLASMAKKGMVVFSRHIRKPAAGHRLQKYVSVIDSDDTGNLTERQAEVYAFVKEKGEARLSDLKKIPGVTSSILKSLENKGFLGIFEKPEYRDPFGEPVNPDIPPLLNQEQENVLKEISSCIGNGFHPFLLDGVTGSGKTEVYMRAVAVAVERGGSAIVLVPEIALISQTERRFRARFGENIAILHSGLSDGERYDQWARTRNGQVKIVIGARSAIFAVLESPSLIIVDEEHDDSYKQDSKLRYNARDLAMLRGRIHGSTVILGSATPSVQSAFNARTGRFRLLELKKRVNQRLLPEIRIVDLRNWKKGDDNSIISPILKNAIRETLGRGEQILLFINRRGHSPFLVCEACGEAVKCANCDISLTYHQRSRAFKCHFCGFSKSAVSRCPGCGSSRIKALGTGSEKIELMIQKMFPSARVDRMDQDTAGTRGSILKILKKLRDGDTDILVGTQMIVKGHDFPGITLVGIICADMSLNFPDYRASERTFQIISQVAGRAGRGDSPGHVIMQTYNPAHYAVSTARDYDYGAFYRQETFFRKSLGYPPYCRIAQIKIWSANEDDAGKFAGLAGERCIFIKSENEVFQKNISILGPVEASLYRMGGNYRWHILVKADSPSVLNSFMRAVTADRIISRGLSGTRFAMDIDPYSMV